MVRIRSADELHRAWQRNVGSAPDEATALPPGFAQVDFATHEVLVIFHGKTVNSPGLEVVEATDEGRLCRVRYQSKSFPTLRVGNDPSGGIARVFAYGFFALPKARGAVVVEQNVQNLIGQPPVRKERARV